MARKLTPEIYHAQYELRKNLDAVIDSRQDKKILTVDDFYKLGEDWYLSSSENFIKAEKISEAQIIYYYVYLFIHNKSIYSQLTLEFTQKKYTDDNIQLLKVICETFSNLVEKSKAYSTLGSFYRERWLSDHDIKFFDLAKESFSKAVELDSSNTKVQEKLDKLLALKSPTHLPPPPEKKDGLSQKLQSYS